MSTAFRGRDAVGFAFRKRERGGVLTPMAVVFLVAMIVAAGVFLAANASGMMAYIAWTQSIATAEPSELGALRPPAAVASMGLSYLALLLVNVVLLAAFEAGAHRWMLRGETGGGLFGLRFDADWGRVLLCYGCWLGLIIGLGIFYLLGAVVAGMVMRGLGALAGPAGGAFGGLLAFIAIVWIIVAIVYVAARFAPAAALTVAREKVSFAQAWAFTRKKGFAIMRAHLLLWLILMAISIVIGILINILLAPVMQATVQAGATVPNFGELIAKIPPLQLAAIGVLYAAMFAAAPAFYLATYGISSAAVAAGEEQAAAT
jgi:hypothetical protein